MSETYKNPTCEVPLYDWLKANGISLAQFARIMRCQRATARLWAFGKSCPSLATAFVIERISNGQVPVSSWLKIPFIMQEVDEALTYIEGPKEDFEGQA